MEERSFLKERIAPWTIVKGTAGVRKEREEQKGFSVLVAGTLVEGECGKVSNRKWVGELKERSKEQVEGEAWRLPWCCNKTFVPSCEFAL